MQGGSKKGKPPTFCHNFIRYWPIFGSFSTDALSSKFAIKSPPHLKRLPSLPREISEWTHQRTTIWLLLAIFYCACAETAMCKLRVKLLIMPSFASATQPFSKTVPWRTGNDSIRTLIFRKAM